eukprot:CAMPEP_0180649308 /NCGR_PEP_ID=MMETSP1037_2-20121125/51508_1 /TAXON_ID=632150 /ORGANISM="Azadinium spinosum, Strain 3D9" /LENGTH=86 /DNA_ID=CAMNT_0022674333 /DNA_START=204 /DNA_END=464 /DNA_ORIENTATION=-
MLATSSSTAPGSLGMISAAAARWLFKYSLAGKRKDSSASMGMYFVLSSAAFTSALRIGTCWKTPFVQMKKTICACDGKSVSSTRKT